MSAINQFALDLGWLVISCALLAGYIWLVSRSPLLSWLTKAALLIGWGLATVGVTVIVLIHQFDERDMLGALLCLVAGGALSIPWFSVALAAIRAAFPPKREQFRIWN